MDFILFKKLISIETLIAFYYLGAIVFPFLLYFNYKKKFKNFFWSNINNNFNLSPKKSHIIMFNTFLFLFLELFWRLLFEFLISYIQVRDKVMEIIIK